MSYGYTPRKSPFFCLKVFIEFFLFAALTILILPVLPAFSQSASTANSASKTEHSVSISVPDSKNVQFQYPEATPEIRNYFSTKYAIGILSPILSSLAIIVMLQTGVVTRLRDKFDRFPYVVSFLLTGFCFYTLVTLIDFPLTYYSSFIVEHQFNLSEQNLMSWLHDFLARSAFGSFIVPVLALVFMLIRKFPRHWVLQVWLLLSALILFVTFLEPLLVDPVFNKFRELESGTLKTKIIHLSDEAGLQNPKILVADKSQQTKKLNAYVTGLGSSNRIVLYDTLLDKGSYEQILAILAHEMGHYRLKHIVLGVSLLIAFLLPMLFLASRCLELCIRYLPRKWGVRTASDPAMIAVLALAGSILPLLISPIPAAISRLIEAEADAYGIRLYGHPYETAEAFKLLSQTNLSDPNPPPFVEFWFFTHPSIKHRIDYALSQIPRD